MTSNSTGDQTTGAIRETGTTDKTPGTPCGPSESVPNRRTCIAIAGIAGALAIAIGAFGAHGLEGYLPQTGIDAQTVGRRLQQFDTGARYHLAHAIVLLILAVAPIQQNKFFRIVFGFFIAGLFLFSGSLYLLVLTNTPVLGAITPIGGVAWILGWCSIAFLNLRN
ncbi:DUF423 domain-containing protein [Neorhodopirellula lusitana]|uniref:DUF423 domain-containing protein n=1 Tax=Neorhodopirellula lusitana TaxID=445327 RepID=UPI00384ED4D1